MMLIKPKRVELSYVDEDGEQTLKYNIGKYNGFAGLDFVEYVCAIVKNGLNFKTTQIGLLRECMQKMGKYIEYVTINDKGEEVALNLGTQSILEASIPSAEIAIQLMLAVHDHNSFFLKAENVSTQLTSMSQLATELITKTLAPSAE